jgi:hypothetical protein
MASQLSSIAASSGLCLLSVLAIALLAVTIYILGVVASFAAFCITELVVRAKDRPPLIRTMFRMLKNFGSSTIMWSTRSPIAPAGWSSQGTVRS